MKYAVIVYMKINKLWYISDYYEFRSNKSKKFLRYVEYSKKLPKNRAIKIERIY